MCIAVKKVRKCKLRAERQEVKLQWDGFATRWEITECFLQWALVISFVSGETGRTARGVSFHFSLFVWWNFRDFPLYPPLLFCLLFIISTSSFSCLILECDNVAGCDVFSGVTIAVGFGAVFRGHSYFRTELCCFVIHHSSLKDHCSCFADKEDECKEEIVVN